MAPSSARTERTAGRAVDRCPYSRVVHTGVRGRPACPAYQATTFTVLDTADRPLRAALTCRHLAVGDRRAPRRPLLPALRARQPRRSGCAGWPSITPARVAVMRSLEEEFERGDRCRARRAADRQGAAAARRTATRPASRTWRCGSAPSSTASTPSSTSGPTVSPTSGSEASQVQELLAEWSMAWLRSRDAFGPAVDGGGAAHRDLTGRGRPARRRAQRSARHGVARPAP